MPTTMAKLMAITSPNQVTSFVVIERARLSSSSRSLACPVYRRKFGTCRVAGADNDVVVHQADGLRKRINNHRPAEIEAALFQILRQSLAHLRFRRHHLLAFVAVDLHAAVHMLPNEMREAAVLFLHDVEPNARTLDCRSDFGAAANDAFVAQETPDLPLSVARDFLRLEAVEGAAEILPLAQDGDP